ncbi:MAG: hypothetical protein QM820_33040 [Minicystis sp.]
MAGCTQMLGLDRDYHPVGSGGSSPDSGTGGSTSVHSSTTASTGTGGAPISPTCASTCNSPNTCDENQNLRRPGVPGIVCDVWAAPRRGLLSQ